MDGGTAIWIELKATDRKSVRKEELMNHAPSAALQLHPDSLNILQHWLAARYRRWAFPDEFDRRLVKTGIAEHMRGILGPFGNHIVAVFFNVDQGEQLEHGDDDPFTLSIDLVHSIAAGSDAAEATTESAVEAIKAARDAAEAAAKSAVEAIKAVFHDRCFDKRTNRWRGIELDRFLAVSDETLTYAMPRRLKRWNADLREDQPMLEE